MTISITPGQRVEYRFWESEEFRTGTVGRVWHGCHGNTYVDIRRDGYRETAVMPLDKFTNPQHVRPIRHHGATSASQRHAQRCVAVFHLSQPVQVMAWLQAARRAGAA